MNKNDKNKSIGSFFKCFLLLIAVVNLCFISIDGTVGYITDKSATCVNTFVAEKVTPTPKPDTDTDTDNNDDDFQADDSPTSPPTGATELSQLTVVFVTATGIIIAAGIYYYKNKYKNKKLTKESK